MVKGQVICKVVHLFSKLMPYKVMLSLLILYYVFKVFVFILEILHLECLFDW